ncbi:hypothetical protein [Halomicrobium urmianum]|uniref:hypothetical protein n=1 Tax=Halomicrobium urmianum TaxID=1586233 RepID=UPI001CD981B2|nr:hypothetical protein [Halomicrobium urmianum]
MSSESVIGDTGHTEVRKDSEFICPRCLARCTESPNKPIEYGHYEGCPRRDDDLPWVGCRTYKPEKDPLLKGSPEVAADGGRLTCDDCGDDIDPDQHKIQIRINQHHLDLCADCQSEYRADRQYAPVTDGGEQQ